jgi:4-amino-4-deoxy-L-arabinose transferase-like glycosyltransferase
MPAKFDHGAPRKWIALVALAQSPVAAVLVVCLAAFSIRLWFALTHPHFNNLFSVRGTPFSDASMWTLCAISLAEGTGLGGVYRPLLSIALAFWYTWFGYSLVAIALVNILAGAITAGLIFLVGRKVFNPLVGAVAAIFFILDPSQIVQTPQATTEPLGLVFFVASIYFLCLTTEQERPKSALLGGCCLGLSNLARPLTLFCTPFYGLHLFVVSWLWQRKPWRALLLPAAFCLGVILAISPWLVRERVVHGVWALSTNTGEALYGTTNPKYKTWTSLVREDADRDGVARDVGARYRYFMTKSLQNVLRYPGLYANEVRDSIWQFLNCFNVGGRRDATVFKYQQWTHLIEAQALFAWLTAALLLAAVIHTWHRSGGLQAGILFVLSATMFAGWRVAPVSSGIVILGLGLITSLVECRWQTVVLLAWSLAITGLGDALFNNAILYRAVLMSDWLFALFYLAAFFFPPRIGARVILRALNQTPAVLLPYERSDSPTKVWISVVEGRIKLALAVAAIILATLIAVSAFRLVIVTFVGGSRARAERFSLSRAEMLETVRELQKISVDLRRAFPDPDAIRFVPPPANLARARQPEAAASNLRSGVKMEIALWVEPLSPFILYFPRGTEFRERDQLFLKRPFDCSIFRSTVGGGMVVFPGRIPSSLPQRLVVLAGWIEGVHPGGPRYGTVMQCAAIIPVLENRRFDYQHAIIAAPKSAGILSVSQ